MSGLSPAAAQRLALLLVLGRLQNGEQDDYAQRAVARAFEQLDDHGAAEVVVAAIEMLADGLQHVAQDPPAAETVKLAIGLLELRGEPVNVWEPL